MDKKIFRNPAALFSVVLFIQEDTFQSTRKDIEDVGNQKNVKFIVQPCPYEGIEFLYQAEFNFPHSHASQEKEFFWHAIEFKSSLKKEELSQISQHHHEFFVSVLDNDLKKIEKERKALESLIQKNW